MPDSFPCNSCGLCCRHLKNVLELASFDRGDGVCRHLVDNRCEIYEARPFICRVDAVHKYLFSHMDKQTFYLENLRVCKALQEEAGLPEELHVAVPDQPA
jgi:uncharacterized protein